MPRCTWKKSAPTFRLPAEESSDTSQMNHAIVAENGLIYTNDRFTGGPVRYTGLVPLD